MKKWIPFTFISVCICAVLIVLFLNSRPNENEKRMYVVKEAYIILQNGDQIECTVRFVGTLYTGSSKVDVDQFFGGVDGGIWIGDTRVLQHYVFVDEQQPVVLGAENGYFYLSNDMTVFIAKMDSAELKLDVDQQSVYIVLKENTPAQYESIMTEIEKRIEQDSKKN